MEICALASGSSGNCFYIRNDKSAVLIDAGKSAKQIVARLEKINQNPRLIKGIFLTHEHSDHIKGVDVFARAFNIPIYATKSMIHSNFLCSNEKLIKEMGNNEVITLGGMKIEAFSKSHKAVDPVSFNIFNGKKISIITDVGYPCKNIISNVSDSDFLCLESNYDTEMLESGPYPYYLKKWIKGNDGHLSNLQASLCVLEHGTPKLKNVILSHISQNNNTPEKAFETFRDLIKERKDLKPKVSVSERFEPTKLFKL
jgi:phosphoribosyl 1,2-cyclic phosphodiesterase